MSPNGKAQNNHGLCFTITQSMRVSLLHLLFKFILCLKITKSGMLFKSGILLFLQHRAIWWYTVGKSNSISFKFWAIFVEQHSFLQVSTASWYSSHCVANSSLIIHSYSSFSLGVTLICHSGTESNTHVILQVYVFLIYHVHWIHLLSSILCLLCSVSCFHLSI